MRARSVVSDGARCTLGAWSAWPLEAELGRKPERVRAGGILDVEDVVLEPHRKPLQQHQANATAIDQVIVGIADGHVLSERRDEVAVVVVPVLTDPTEQLEGTDWRTV